MNTPEASVIIPVYNAENYLKQCLDSVKNQTFSDYEVILIDDGSTDSSGMICDQYVKQDHRFSVWHQRNGGVSAARKRGLEKARGKYIFWIDADDWCDPNLLEIVTKKFQNGRYDIVVWGWNNKEEIVRADFREKPLKEWQESVLLGKGTTLWLFAAVRALWRQIEFPDDMNAGGEDGYACLAIFMRAKNIGVYPKILYHHRNALKTSVSHRISSRKYYDTMRLWKKREEIAEKLFPQHVDTCQTGILTSAVKAYCMNFKLNDLNAKEIKSVEQQLKQISMDHISRRWKEKILRWCILHRIGNICRWYGKYKCRE